MKNRAYRKEAAAAGGVAALVLGAITGTARAQNRPPAVPRPFAVKAGLRFPNDNTIKNVFGDTWFSVGASYDFERSKTANPVVYQLYVDYTSRRTGGAGSPNGGTSADVTGRLLGIGPAVKFLLAPLTARAQPYVGVGVGYYRATVPVLNLYNNYVVTSPILPTGSVGTRSTGAPGGKIFAGYQIKEGFMAEADFTYVREIDSLKTGGLGLRVGYRF